MSTEALKTVMAESELLASEKLKARRRVWPLEGDAVWEPVKPVDPDVAESFRPHGFVKA